MKIKKFKILFNQIDTMFKNSEAYKRQLSGESYSPLYFDLENTSFEQDGITSILKDVESYRIFCNLGLFLDNEEDSFQNFDDIRSIIGMSNIIFNIEDDNNLDKSIPLNLGRIWKVASFESDCKLANYKFNVYIDYSDEISLLNNLKELSSICLLAPNLDVDLNKNDLSFLLNNHQNIELSNLDFNLEIEDIKNSDYILNEYIFDYFKHIKTKHLNMNLNVTNTASSEQIYILLKKHLSILNSCDILITDKVENEINLNLSFSENLNIDLEKIQNMFKEYYIIKGDIKSDRSQKVC